jgi:hypothetical protein
METSVYLVVSNCGDYYCGCGLGHLAAVAHTRDDAEALMELAKRAEHSYGGGRWYATYEYPYIVEVPVGVVQPYEHAQAAQVTERVRAEA